MSERAKKVTPFGKGKIIRQERLTSTLGLIGPLLRRPSRVRSKCATGENAMKCSSWFSRSPSLTRTGIIGALLWVGAGCAGGQRDAKAPEEPPAAEAASAEESEPSGDADATESADPDAAPERAQAEKEPLRSPQDIITSPDIIYMFSFNASEPFQAAEKNCTEKSGDDPKKHADCMSKARKRFNADGISFEKDDAGQWWWLTVRRQGSKLITLHKVAVDFADETKDSITLKTSGRDKGRKPWVNVPKEVVIEVPNESEIAIKDPKDGKLVYQAKIGIVGE